jgi:phospholipid/cholesterol/gamma-HCH transport system substrate-binding protein
MPIGSIARAPSADAPRARRACLVSARPCGFATTGRSRGQSGAVGPLGLLQGRPISIEPGSSADLYADGAVIDAAASDVDLTERLADLTETVRTVVEDSIAPTLASIRDQVKTIELLIGTGEDQGENRDRLAGAFENLRLLSDNLVTAVDPEAIGAILDSVREMSESLGHHRGA